jgi:4-amino-4-deoxy-L-arabinose transferase-like glycosyltransferase
VKRYLSAALIAGSAVYVLLFVGVALARIRYPYELEWMEGGMVEHVRRILEGRPLYAKPTLEFVSFLYPPGYYLASAAVACVTGIGFFPLRLLSFLSSLGVFALVAALARKETGSWHAGAVAAGIFAATYARSGGWLDLARLDAFYMLLLLGGAFAWIHATSRRACVVAGLLVASAFFTKQSALVALLPLVVHRAVASRRQALWSGATALLAIGSGVLVLDLLSDHWFRYYAVTLPSQHPRLPGGWWKFWIHDLLPTLPFALPAAIAAAVWRRSAALPMLALGLLVSSWSVRSVYGAEINNLLPAFAGVALLAATLSRYPVFRDLLLAGQLLWLGYSPAALVPGASDRLAGDEAVRRLSMVGGEVFIPHHGYLARRAGKPETAHTLAMDNVFLDDQGPARRDLETEVRLALSAKRFGAAVIESDGRYTPWILEGYEPRARLIDRPDAFWPVSGGRLRPETLALPRVP